MILSQNAGASSFLKGALIVDPRQKAQIALAIESAIKMSPQERKVRNATNLEYIEKMTSKVWMREFLKDLDSDFK